MAPQTVLFSEVSLYIKKHYHTVIMLFDVTVPSHNCAQRVKHVI